MAPKDIPNLRDHPSTVRKLGQLIQILRKSNMGHVDYTDSDKMGIHTVFFIFLHKKKTYNVVLIKSASVRRF